MIREIASDDILDEAFGWLGQRRNDYSHNNDVWDLRRNWERIKPKL
jgi:RNA-directed DNA polymerase